MVERPEATVDTAVRRAERCRGDRGAALVETAVIAPFLFLIMFGIIEFGLLFGIKLDVSQGSREASRLAAVNYQAVSTSTGSTQTSEIVAATCARMELADSSMVSISLPSGTSIGDTVEITITTPADPVTGMFDPWLSGTTVTSTLQTRLEQTATYAATTAEACP